MTDRRTDICDCRVASTTEMSKKGDIVHIRVSTNPTPPISDVKFSDISSQ